GNFRRQEESPLAGSAARRVGARHGAPVEAHSGRHVGAAAGPGQFAGRGIESGHQARSDREGAGGPALRLEGLQAREVQRDCVCERRRHAGCRRRPDEPRGLRENRRGQSAKIAARQRGGFRCVLPVPGWSGRSGQGGRDGGDSAGRLDQGCGSDRRGGPAGIGDGVYQHEALPALRNGRMPGIWIRILRAMTKRDSSPRRSTRGAKTALRGLRSEWQIFNRRCADGVERCSVAYSRPMRVTSFLRARALRLASGRLRNKAMRRSRVTKASRKARSIWSGVPTAAAGSGTPQCAVTGWPGQRGQTSAAALSQTVKTKFIRGAPGLANSSQLLLRRPATGKPATSSCFSASGLTRPVGWLPALKAWKLGLPRWFKIASARMERAEFPVQRNSTL